MFSIFAAESIIELRNGEKLYMDHNLILRRHQMTIFAKNIIQFWLQISLDIMHAIRRDRSPSASSF